MRKMRNLRASVFSVPCTRELVCSIYFPRNGDSKASSIRPADGIPKSWVTNLEALDLMGSDTRDTDPDVIHTLHKLGLSGAVISGVWDSKVVTTTYSDSGVASQVATPLAGVNIDQIADSVSGASSSSGERTVEVESTGVADSYSGRIVDLGVSSVLSGVRASDDEVSADYARTGVAVANIGSIASSDAVKAADIDGYGTVVSNIGPNANSGLSISDLLGSAPLSSVPGRSDNGIHPEVSFLGLDDGDLPPIRLLSGSGKGFSGKGNGASLSSVLGKSHQTQPDIVAIIPGVDMDDALCVARGAWCVVRGACIAGSVLSKKESYRAPYSAADADVPNVARKSNSVVANLGGRSSPSDYKSRLPLGFQEGSVPLGMKGSPTPPENIFILPMSLGVPASTFDRSSKGFLKSWNVVIDITTDLQGYDLSWSEPANGAKVRCPVVSGHGRGYDMQVYIETLFGSFFGSLFGLDFGVGDNPVSQKWILDMQMSQPLHSGAPLVRDLNYVLPTVRLFMWVGRWLLEFGAIRRSLMLPLMQIGLTALVGLSLQAE